MPLASWLSRACVPMGLRSWLAAIGRIRGARLIGLARFATVDIFRIVSLRPNGHCEILQLFPNRTQFVDDLFGYLVFHTGRLPFYIPMGHLHWVGHSCIGSAGIPDSLY